LLFKTYFKNRESVNNEKIVFIGVVGVARLFFGERRGSGRENRRIDADSEFAAVEPGRREHESPARSGGI
jgi:hypothetical protein